MGFLEYQLQVSNSLNVKISDTTIKLFIDINSHQRDLPDSFYWWPLPERINMICKIGDNFNPRLLFFFH